MLGFIKRMFIATMTFVASNALISLNPLKCVSRSNQECKVRPAMMNVNSNKPLFYPYIVLVNKCSGTCNNINNPYAKLCVPGAVKDINIKLFNLVSRTNKTRYLSWYKTCACKCRLDVSICNDRQCWHNDKLRCECKELIDKGRFDCGFMLNPSACEYECDKLCHVGKFLDYVDCKCRKRVTHKLVKVCTEYIDENEMAYNASFDFALNKKVCKSRMLNVIVMGISGACLYFYWYMKRNYANALSY